MFEKKSDDVDEHDGDVISFGARLLITATISSAKYGRFWSRLYVRFVISLTLKKGPRNLTVSSSSLQSLPSPSSSVPCVPLPSDSVSASSGQLSRTLSNRSQHVIDVPSDNEEERRDEQQPHRDSIVRIVQERDLPALKKFGGVEQVAMVYDSNLETGINCGEQDSLVWNTYNPIHAKGFFYYFVKACNSYTVFILLISAGLSFGVEMAEQGTRYGWHDGVAILFALFLLVTLPSVANFCRSKKLEKKQWKKNNELKVKVVRSGKNEQVNVSHLMEGDLVLLEKGDLVPADGLFVSGDALVLDEALNSKINHDTNPFIFSGSKITEGHGRMLVILVGANTALGEALSLVTRDPHDRTFLEAQIDKPNSYIDNIALSVSMVIAFVVLIGILCRGQHKNGNVLPELKGNVPMDVLMKTFESIVLRPRGRIRILAGALTAIVIGIQHGMPFVITVSLTCWNKKLELERVKPQNLSACGTMGLVKVICIDATGEFICNQMEVNKFFVGENDVMNIDVDSETNQHVLEALRRGIGVSALVPEFSAGPTNDLLISWAKSKWGINMELSDQCFSVLDYRRLSFNKKGSWVLMKENGDHEKFLHLHLEGAASTILKMCSHYYDTRGKIHAIKDQRSNFQELINDMEVEGLRAIAFACKKTEIPEVGEDGFHLIAIVGLKYTCQEETQSAVDALIGAGVTVKLVSQDELSVVRTIACELGIFQPRSNDVELEGEQIQELTMEKIEQVIVMGNCLPKHKLLLVQSLQKNGHLVAFFGGSTASDIPALKEADVGITKETQSTEMAKESSDIIISEESSLFEVLKFGRCAYHNIQKFTQLQLTACMSGLLINLVAAISLWDPPLTTIQLIWVNFVMWLLGGLTMVMELSSQELKTNPPAKRTQSLVTKAMWKDILIQVSYQASVLLILHLSGQAIPSMSEEVWKSLVFNSFMLCQVFNQFNAMELLRKEVIEVLLNGHWFLVALVALMVMQVLLVEFAKSLGDCVRLNLVHWEFSFIIAALSWGFECAVKFISISLSNWFLRSDGSHHVFSGRRRRPWSYVSYLYIPFSILFFFSLSYYFVPDSAQTFR